MTENHILQGLRTYQPWFSDYFTPWTYNAPVLVSKKTDNEVAQLQKTLYKIIVHFVENYPRYEHLMPVSDDVKRILSFFSDTPYQVGSYRTDFVIDENHQFKLIEITCRFAMNGYWLSAMLDELSQDYATEHNIPHQSYNQAFCDYLQARFADKDIIILASHGKGEESRHYVKILTEAGFNIHTIYPEDIEESLQDISNKVFITELNQDDYYALSDNELKQLASADLFNDLRTIFLVHDKRFFAVLGDADIRNAVLSPQEQALLEKYYIPTYCYGEHPHYWDDAKNNKNNWILKHKHLGKSASVYAGSVTSDTEWQSLFQSTEIENMVLQPFIQQPRFTGHVHEQQHHDYVVGTMLFIDDHYFGLGVFRASSHVITNVVDDRKLLHINVVDDVDMTINDAIAIF